MCWKTTTTCDPQDESVCTYFAYSQGVVPPRSWGCLSGLPATVTISRDRDFVIGFVHTKISKMDAGTWDVERNASTDRETSHVSSRMSFAGDANTVLDVATEIVSLMSRALVLALSLVSMLAKENPRRMGHVNRPRLDLEGGAADKAVVER